MNREEKINDEQEEILSENTEDQDTESQANLDEEKDDVVDKPGDKLGEQLNEFKDKYLRLYSEFENFRRRTSKEKLEMIQSANEQLVKSLLPVLDDCERAEKAMGQHVSQETEGILLIFNKFRKIMEQSGVKPLPVESGSGFDPDLQEAVTQIPAPDESLKGKVVDVVEKGYQLNDKVIRYAKVVVGN